MILANLHGHRVPATPRTTEAICPTCAAPVIPKCGRINIWHWAHAAGQDCDPWAEPISAWHLNWQATVPTERREVVIGNHRADILTTTGIIVEIQHSNISPDEIRARELHYGKMIWIFDTINAAQPTEYENHYDGTTRQTTRMAVPWSARLDIRTPERHPDPIYRTFRWKHARKSIAACRAPVYLDLGDELLRLGRIHPGPPCGGWGRIVTRQQLVDAFNAVVPS